MPRKSRPSVLIITHYYPPHIGGIEFVAQAQAIRLVKLGYKVTVITSKAGRAQPKSMEDGVLVVRVPAFNIFEKFGIPYPLFSPRLLFVLRAHVAKADILHIHDALYLSSFWAAVLGSYHKKPIVLSQHVAEVGHNQKIIALAQRLLYASVGRYVYSKSSKIFTLNDRVDALLASLGVDKSKIVPYINGVDTTLFHPASRAEKQRLKQKYGLVNKNVVLFVGRFVYKKGYTKLLALNRSNFELVMVGGSSAGPEVNNPNVTFFGKLTQAALAEVYRLADLFVLPSEDEGFPLTVQEAMASGLPVITADDPGYNRYHFDRSHIRLIRPTARRLSESIHSVLKNEALRRDMGNYSRRYALNELAWKKSMSTLENTYSDLLAPKIVPAAKAVVVTTSWDDGHKLDLKLARLLTKYNMAATFYIAPHNREFVRAELLSRSQIVKLGRQFEIGAHTMTHPRLVKISDEIARQEIVGSKAYLEKLLKKPVTSFCYPRGQYHKAHVLMVKDAGFRYARTVRRHDFNKPVSYLEVSTTVHAYNHWLDIYKIARFARFNPKTLLSYRNWDNLAIAMFERVRLTGGVYHLWGHSWEIDNHKHWQKLEKVLRHIANQPGVIYASNGQSLRPIPPAVLIAAPYWPPHTGGQEQYAYSLAQTLQKHYHWRVVVAVSGRRGLSLKREVFNGLLTYRLPYWFKISNTPFNPMWPRMLKRLLRSEQIDIINSQAPVPGLAETVAYIRQPAPVVLTYHMLSMKKHKTIADWLIGVYESVILPAHLKRLPQTISASDSVKQYLNRLYNHRSETIAPGVDNQRFLPAKNPPNTARILFVGSLHKTDTHKGLDVLLQAMPIVIQKQPDVELVVVGGGSNLNHYKSLVRNQGLVSHVRFRGPLSGHQLVAAYQAAAVFVLPSLNDNIPLTILEAMSCGLPVVSTTVGNIPKLISESSDGYLVAPGDHLMLAERLIAVLRSPKQARAMGVKGRRKVLAGYTLDKQAADTSRIFKRVLKAYRYQP